MFYRNHDNYNCMEWQNKHAGSFPGRSLHCMVLSKCCVCWSEYLIKDTFGKRFKVITWIRVSYSRFLFQHYNYFQVIFSCLFQWLWKEPSHCQLSWKPLYNETSRWLTMQHNVSISKDYPYLLLSNHYIIIVIFLPFTRISPYPSMLHKYASESKWDDAIRLCRFVKVSR